MVLKKIGLALLFLGSVNCIKAQIKIGDNPQSIETASLLELESTTRALVLTRLSSEEMMAITPLQGALVYNISEQCVFYFNGGQWNNLCAGLSNLTFIDNGDGTFTIDVANGPITFNGAPETLTSLIENSDGSYTFTNEAGETTVFSTNDNGGTAVIDNGDGSYTVDDGINPPFAFDGSPETVTNIVNNDDGTYTYTAEDGLDIQIQTGILGGDHIGSPGSVFFANSSTGGPFEANEHFFWDNTNKRLGIGTNTPTNDLHVDGIMRSGRISNSQGTAAFPSYHFTGSFNTGLFSPTPGKVALAAGGQEVLRVTNGNRVGVMVTNPLATLHVGGNLRVDGTITTGSGKAINKSILTPYEIRRVSKNDVALILSDHTLILEETVMHIKLPTSNESNKGHIFIIKDLGGVLTKFDTPYRNFKNKLVFTTIEAGVLWLQSDGKEWQQVN